MKNKKSGLRLLILTGLVVASAGLLTACGETETKTETVDTVVTTPAPVEPVIVDTAAIDTGRNVMDPKKPD